MADNWTLIQQQFNAVRSYASDSFGLAKGYISDLSSFVLGTISMTPPSIDIPTSDSITVDPTLVGELPTAPEDSDYPLAPTAPTDTSDHAFPVAETYSWPTAPTITDIVIPSYVEGVISDITSTLPVIDFSVPAQPAIDNGGQATLDSLLQAARDKLESFISSGGTMIDPTVEDDIFDRDLERREQLLRDDTDKITARWARLGWSLPDGLLASQFMELQNKYTDGLTERSRDIAIKQAELEQQGVFKSIELAIGVEKIIIDSYDNYAARVLDASKATAAATIDIYKTRVTQFNAQLEAFKADVETYKATIQAELARAEAYRAKVEGLKAVAEVDKTRVQVYSAHISAIGQMVEVYKTEIQAVALMYEADKQKIERYKAQVEAYVAGVDAVTKKYAAAVEGFKAYVTAYNASADVQTKVLDVSTRAKIAEVEATIKEWEIEMKILQENNMTRLEALRTVAQTASSLAAGALSAGHASASASFGESVSTATSHSYSY